MPTPYWGELPGPSVSRQPRRLSEAGPTTPTTSTADHLQPHSHYAYDDLQTSSHSAPQEAEFEEAQTSQEAQAQSRAHYREKEVTFNLPPHTTAADHGPSSPQDYDNPPQRRRSKRLQKLPHQVAAAVASMNNNRASVQTANTDFTYEEPPTPSHPSGLAPRPTTYDRGELSGQHQDMAPSDHRRHSRRQSRQLDDYDDYAAHSHPGASSDAQRGPPLSYREPHGSVAQYNQIPAVDHHHQQHYDRKSEPNVASSSPRTQNGASAVPLNVSAGSTPDRRKVYTKEEKRARVEAAERRARERAALRAGVPPAIAAAAHQHDSTPERRTASARYESSPAQRELSEPRDAGAPGLPPAVAPQAMRTPEPPRDLPRAHGSHKRGQPSQHASIRSVSAPFPAQAAATTPTRHREPEPEFRPEVEPDQFEAQSGIPKRNLSFRERANKDHANLPAPTQEPIYNAPPQASTSGGLSLSREGSNKLRKDPPGDPWFHRRMEAERQMPSVTKKTAQAGSAQHVAPALNKDLPPGPPQPARTDDDHLYSNDPRGYGAAAAAGGLAAAAAISQQPGLHRQPTEALSPGYESDEKYVPTKAKRKDLSHWGYDPAEADRPPPGVEAARRQLEGMDSEHESDHDDDSSTGPQQQSGFYGNPKDYLPGRGRYKSPEWLNEWEKGTVGTLTGPLLDFEGPFQEPEADDDSNKAWWEGGGRSRRNSSAARPRRAEAFDGEYDDTNGAATRFKPALYLKCGPLLRYTGLRTERVQSRTKGGATTEREMWRGSVMIVTHDAESSYEIAPTLRLFVQDLELLPAPPHRVNGDLSPEYVDPIAGHPKLGRKGETLYVRPVDHLEEAKDLSRDETDDGLFEAVRSPADNSAPGAQGDGSYTSRRARVEHDGERLQKYKDVRGFRLHTEQGCTFWRFNIEIELRERQQRIAYRINRGPAMAFWVPQHGQTMNMMFHSCNGFSLSAKPDDFSGPDPMWRDVLNNHQTQPFHVMIGGGDQIYNDCVAEQTELFGDWLDMKHGSNKQDAPFTSDMQEELEEFYFERYCMWFSQGLFGLATSQIPMVNMFDDHDIFDGYGSYPDSEMSSPVLCGLGAVAFKYYMLFQQQSIVPETEKTEPSLIMGLEPGPYINELSRSLYVSMGAKVSLLAVDARTERTEMDVLSSKTWEKIMNRLYAEVRKGQVEHLLVLLGVPIAYPRLVWLENILTSRMMDPIKALGKTGLLGKSLNSIDGGVEVLDDLNDHWTAKNHKQERSLVIEDLQDLAIDKSLRITILSGDVHLAAIGQFFSNPKLGLLKHKDPRYMPNIISSAIANAPPPDLMADVLNKRNKVHHFDKQTDEDMIPIFQTGVDGKPRNNKRLLPHRNWCSIRQWQPGMTPPPSPPPEDDDRSRSPERSGRGPMALIRRLSRSRSRQARPEPRDSVRGPKPPISGGGAGFFRSLSRRGSKSAADQPPQKLTRSMSLGGDDAQQKKPSFFSSFRRRGSQSRPNETGVIGDWGPESEGDDDDYYYNDPRAYGDPRTQGQQPVQPHPHMQQQQQQQRYAQPSGLRGGGLQDAEFSEGDEEYFTARPPARAQTMGSAYYTPQEQFSPQQHARNQQAQDPDFPPTRPFHRTPTGLSTKQMRQAEDYAVDLEGGLDICLNVEVNPKDPSGITVPYRMLIPKLFYEYVPGEDDMSSAGPERQGSRSRGGGGGGGGAFKRLLSFRKKNRDEEKYRDYESDEEDEDDGYDGREQYGEGTAGGQPQQGGQRGWTMA